LRFEVLTAVKIDIHLSCGAVWTCRWIPPFWRNILPSSSGLEGVSESLVSTYQAHMESQPRTTSSVPSIFIIIQTITLKYIDAKLNISKMAVVLIIPYRIKLM
jgi:hypothetical protein